MECLNQHIRHAAERLDYNLKLERMGYFVVDLIPLNNATIAFELIKRCVWSGNRPVDKPINRFEDNLSQASKSKSSS